MRSTGTIGLLDRSTLPDDQDCVDYVRELGKPTAAEVMPRAQDGTPFAIQPRCGVGDHDAMLTLLRTLESGAHPDLLTVTIDSHTRLGHFDVARRTLAANPSHLNGYPLVTHGWRRGRELNEAVASPLEVRHGSPDGRALFEVAVASGITSFEGGGLSYNLPYSKNVPIAQSLSAWQEIDARCGALAELGLIIDRELFGTLTAVLVPPSISLAVTLIEAALAIADGVRCVSIAYPQGGNLVQDVAALRAIRRLAQRYLPEHAAVHTVLHEFMGVFPRQRDHAEALILYGAIAARLGMADKLITKTYQEAHGIPDAVANIAGLRLARLAASPLFSFVTDEAAVAAEMDAIEREVADIVDPLFGAPDLPAVVVAAFESGRMDIPFSASRHARSAILPRRDALGAIRYFDAGGLPFSSAAMNRNDDLLAPVAATGSDHLSGVTADINYFRELLGELE